MLIDQLLNEESCSGVRMFRLQLGGRMREGGFD
jgi:hypothetical protein